MKMAIFTVQVGRRRFKVPVRVSNEVYRRLVCEVKRSRRVSRAAL